MKLLVDCHCFDYPYPQGINTYLKGLYSALFSIAGDIEFYLCAANESTIRKIFGWYPNVHYVKLPKGNSISRLLWQYPKIIKDLKIDWAHFQYINPLIKNCKTITTIHDVLFIDYPNLFPPLYKLTKKPTFKYSANHTDILLTVSEYSKDRIQDNFRLGDKPIFVTPNAVDEINPVLSTLEAKKIISKKFGVDNYILSVSRLEPRKNQVAIIKSFIKEKIYNKGYHLIIVGQKSVSYPEFDATLSKLNSEEVSFIKILNGVDNEELQVLYKGASLFVYPAIAEGFGIPPLEAAVAGVPVICNNKTAMMDFDFFGKNLIDTSDQEELTKAILNSINSPISNFELDDIANRVRKKYNWNSIALNYYQILKDYENNSH